MYETEALVSTKPGGGGGGTLGISGGDVPLGP